MHTIVGQGAWSVLARRPPQGLHPCKGYMTGPGDAVFALRNMGGGGYGKDAAWTTHRDEAYASTDRREQCRHASSRKTPFPRPSPPSGSERTRRGPKAVLAAVRSHPGLEHRARRRRHPGPLPRREHVSWPMATRDRPACHEKTREYKAICGAVMPRDSSADTCFRGYLYCTSAHLFADQEGGRLRAPVQGGHGKLLPRHRR